MFCLLILLTIFFRLVFSFELFTVYHYRVILITKQLMDNVPCTTLYLIIIHVYKTFKHLWRKITYIANKFKGDFIFPPFLTVKCHFYHLYQTKQRLKSDGKGRRKFRFQCEIPCKRHKLKSRQ